MSTFEGFVIGLLGLLAMTSILMFMVLKGGAKDGPTVLVTVALLYLISSVKITKNYFLKNKEAFKEAYIAVGLGVLIIPMLVFINLLEKALSNKGNAETKTGLVTSRVLGGKKANNSVVTAC